MIDTNPYIYIHYKPFPRDDPKNDPRFRGGGGGLPSGRYLDVCSDDYHNPTQSAQQQLLPDDVGGTATTNTLAPVAVVFLGVVLGTGLWGDAAASAAKTATAASGSALGPAQEGRRGTGGR